MENGLKVVVVGMGFMGKVHAGIWRSLPGVELVGVVDGRPENTIRREMAAAGLPGETPVFSSLDEALDRNSPDVVDLCTPTFLHAEQGRGALRAGCHLFCEKPITLDLPSADRLLELAEEAGRQIMVGHCLRFWPEYECLRSAIRTGELGKLLFLDMERTAGRPGYVVGGWTNDLNRCVGAALDMHIHDADWIQSVFGLPEAVASQGVKLDSGWDYLATHYHFRDGAAISARGGWCLPPGAPLRMGYQAVFERGLLEWNSNSTEGVIRFSEAGREVVMKTEDHDPLVAYRRQIEYFANCLCNRIPVTNGSGRQARESVRLVLAEIESAASGSTVSLGSAPRG